MKKKIIRKKKIKSHANPLDNIHWLKNPMYITIYTEIKKENNFYAAIQEDILYTMCNISAKKNAFKEIMNNNDNPQLLYRYKIYPWVGMGINPVRLILGKIISRNRIPSSMSIDRLIFDITRSIIQRGDMTFILSRKIMQERGISPFM